MKRAQKKREREIFESIRKPTAPPTRKLGSDKPETKVHPAGRKAKHKVKETAERTDADL